MRFLLVTLSIAAALADDRSAFLAKNCTTCHRGPTAPAGIDLDALSFRLDDVHTFNLWVRVHDAVRGGTMPPGQKLAPQEREAFLKTIGEPMRSQERQHAEQQGRAVLRRLNRYEYENTIRELLASPWLQLRDSLPEDGTLQRFNKSGQALDVSHVQMSRYMETAGTALRMSVAASREPQATTRYYAREQKTMIRRMKYDAFNHHPERASIPILGFDAQPEVLHEKAPMTVGVSDPKTRELEAFVTSGSTYTGNNYHFDQFTAHSGGTYRLRFNAYSIWVGTVWGTEGVKDRTPWWHPDREKTSRGRTTEPITIYAFANGSEKRLLGSFDVGPEPGVYELEVSLMPGDQILPDASRLFRSRPTFTASPDATAEGIPGVAYRWMEVAGPIQSAGMEQRSRNFFGSDPSQAESLVRNFMAAAYRRPPEENEVRRYLRIVQDRMSAKDADFQEALIAGYTAILCSPGFLYLEERPGVLDSNALASRLSYFLWNGPPDQQLRKLAATGKLANPDALRSQSNRLLDDPRSGGFINAFLDYWLDLRRIGETTPDQTLYPDYYLDDLLIESALQETQLFFRDLVQHNLPVSNVVQSSFTILNSHLARHYGLPPVNGVAMRKVQLPPDSVRGGLLTQASVLKVTANGTTTSPVLRGVWLMERILGDPPPPPPPGVPAVEPDTRGATTIRQQLDKHRSNPACAACHAKIDPPGFALENFDVFGAWRDRYRSTDQGDPVLGLGKNGFLFTFRKSQPVDAGGKLANGETFRDVVELKRLLSKDERQLARNMVKQFIAYATGAPAGFGDREEVERILNSAQKDHYGMRTLILEVVRSPLFTHK